MDMLSIRFRLDRKTLLGLPVNWVYNAEGLMDQFQRSVGTGREGYGTDAGSGVYQGKQDFTVGDFGCKGRERSRTLFVVLIGPKSRLRIFYEFKL